MSDAPEQNLKAPLRRLTGVQVIATGSYVPEIVVRNEDLAKYGCDPQWIVQRSGIRERRQAPPDMCTSDWLRWRRDGRCKARTFRPPISICLCSARSRPICPSPPPPVRCKTSWACTARRSMSRRPAPASCTPWSPARSSWPPAAVGWPWSIGADANSRIVEPHDKKTYPLFGDGAGAVLLAAGSDDQGLIAYTMGADGSGEEMLCMKAGGSRNPATVETVQPGDHFMRMDGRAVFKWAVRLIDRSVRDVLDHAKITIDEVDLVVLHQANIRILDAAAEELGIDRRKMFVNLEQYGNTSAGSIPLALDEAMQQGLIQRGSKIVLCGFGAALLGHRPVALVTVLMRHQ